MSLAAQLIAAFAAVPLIEWVAAVLALGYLVLAIRQSAWCWVFAVVSAVLFLVVFARAGLYMQGALQVFYVGMGIYGWHTWGGKGAGPSIAVSRWTGRQHLLACAGIATVSLITGALMQRGAQDAWLPYIDAAIAWGSVLTTWMVTRKVLENWLYWIVLDAAMVVLSARQGLAATSVLFGLYTALAVRGYWQWRRDLIAAAP